MSEQGRPTLWPLRIGCAGWSLASKDASAFPTEGTHLERYSQVFSCVEINSSFYRSHQEKTYRRWAAGVPDGFRFSVKLPRTMTHELRLQRCEDPLRTFIQEVSALGKKLGCLLVQLPPSLALDVKIARRFFSLLRDSTQVPIACEPRHATWFTAEGASVLSEAGISCVWADPPPVAGAQPHIDTKLLYIRLHGSPQVYYSAYDDAFLEGIALRMRHARESGAIVWCIFDNTARGEAVPNALTLKRSSSS
jgi:uncharacterized protein YecE (DUF72 family)